jgi:hypothetical protein
LTRVFSRPRQPQSLLPAQCPTFRSSNRIFCCPMIILELHRDPWHDTGAAALSDQGAQIGARHHSLRRNGESADCQCLGQRGISSADHHVRGCYSTWQIAQVDPRSHDRTGNRMPRAGETNLDEVTSPLLIVTWLDLPPASRYLSCFSPDPRRRIMQ